MRPNLLPPLKLNLLPHTDRYSFVPLHSKSPHSDTFIIVDYLVEAKLKWALRFACTVISSPGCKEKAAANQQPERDSEKRKW